MSKFEGAYTTVEGNKPGERIGLVKYNETGYYACPGWDDPSMSIQEVRDHVAFLNGRLEIPADVAESMSFASCFGWDKPIAERAHEYFKNQTEA
jgi:hypothetical protein